MKKEYRKTKIFGIIVSVIMVFLLAINIIPPAKAIDDNPFIVGNGKLPMIAAHRGGGENNPENTMLAFREAVKTIGVDILESDLYLTKDGYLVYNHDEYIDRTSNVNGDKTKAEVEALIENKENRHYISDMTLAELKQYNFGYYFEDEKGQRPYKDLSLVEIEELGLQIATVEMLFEEFYTTHPDLLFIVEIKDGEDRGKLACKKLNDVLNNFPKYKDRIVVGTFHDEIEKELKTNYPDLMRGASTGVAAGFIITQMTRTNLFNSADFVCLQIPTSYEVGITLSLDSKSLIDRAHRRNIAVQYWTINSEREMRHLIDLGCDCIMTDNPALMRKVLSEYTYPDNTGKIIGGIITGILATACLVLSIMQFKQKGFLLNNAYIYASKTEREKMYKKPFYIQTGIVFLLLFIVFLATGLATVFNAEGFYIMAVFAVAICIIYAIASTVTIMKKRNRELEESKEE